MSDGETITVTATVSKRQLQDVLSAINSKEVELTDRGERDRSLALTSVWADLYRQGRDGFDEGMKR